MTPLRQLRARNLLRRKRSGGTTRQPMSLPVHVLIMVTGALVLLVALLWLLMNDTTSPLSPYPDDQTILEVVRLAFYAVAGIGGVIALTVAYRRQRLTESEIVREDAKLFNERFAATADQLASERAANRLAGIYAMAALADEWDAGRQTCIDVLCAYMRMPYEPPPPRSEREEVGLEPFKEVLEERLVRKTVMTVIADHLRAEQVEGRSWHWCDFDFTGATIDECNFHDAVFKGTTTFSYARFPRGNILFSGAEFHGAIRFFNARFTGARMFFRNAQFFRGANFTQITVVGGRMSFVGCGIRSGRMRFNESTFTGGTMTFESSRFEPRTIADFRNVSFSGTKVSFRFVEFDGAALSFLEPAAWSHPPQFEDFPEGPPPGLRLPTPKA